MWDKRRRFPRPAYLAVLALVLIVGGCWAMESAVTLASGPTSGYSYSGQGQSAPAGGQAKAPTVGPPLPPPAPNTPTWTGTLRVTADGIDMARQPPASTATVGGTPTVQFKQSDSSLYLYDTAATWTSPTDPTYEQCLQLLQTQPLSASQDIPYAKGRGLCLLAGDKTAVGFVRGLSDSTASDGVQVHGIRWAM